MNTTADSLICYIGTYTSGESKGIYMLDADKKTGAIRQVSPAAELDNPTYLCIDKNNCYLYSVAKLGGSGGVAAFSIDPSTLRLIPVNHQVSCGNPPCHVSLDSSGKYLFSANYHKGEVEVFPTDNHGVLQYSSSHSVHVGSGPNRERQEKPHIHYSALTPDEKYLCVIDLGIDKLVVYSFSNGKISEWGSLSLSPGSGPRHMDFHPSGGFAFLLTELGSELITLEYNPSRGCFSELQSISTLPSGFIGENLGGAVHVSPDGKYAYASNRGHDSIAAFKIDESSGRLEFISHTPCGGSFPRDFAIAPGGSFLYAANQNSNSIVPFAINKASGKLAPAGPPVYVPNPVCIKFLNE